MSLSTLAEKPGFFVGKTSRFSTNAEVLNDWFVKNKSYCQAY